MAQVQTFAHDDDADQIFAAFVDDGAAIVTGLCSDDQRAAVSEQIAPYVTATPTGLDDFTGRQTQRTGALVARSEACRELVMQPLVVGMANRFLEPYCERIQLHLTQVINIGPAQGAQPLHRDRLAWGGYVPREIEPQFNTMWALTDFTEENGATRIVPGSVSWDDDRRASDDEKAQAVMPAGSVLFYSGSVIHGGGENRTEVDRTGINITYCLGWLRTEENQYLSCPPEIAKDLNPDLQDMLGYTQGSYALGYFSDPAGIGERSDIQPPELRLGRKPQSRRLLGG